MRQEGWDTALDLQTDLISASTTREGREFLDSVAESMGRAGQWDSRTGDVAPPNPEYAHLLVNATALMLPNADPFYVSDELSELIDFAAGTLHPEPLILTDLLVPSGFAYFAKPIHVTDTNGLSTPFRAIQWNPVSDHRVSSSGMPMPVDLEVTQQNGEAPPQFTGILFAMYQHVNDPDPYAEHHNVPKLKRVAGSDLTLAYATSIVFESDPQFLEADNSIADMFAHMKTFFRLCQQTIAVPRHERVSRPVFKRAARRWKPIKSVVVFTLRRAKPPQYEGPEREVHWSHRWLVQGHWRNQWYPSEQVHRQIWVAPYVKGPDDKPLIFKRRAFELVR